MTDLMLGCLALSIMEGADTIADSNYAIAEAQKQIAVSNMNIAVSNMKIAREIFDASELMFEGLSSIANEMERKRKTDEYYMLINLIDSLEDKIIRLGGSLVKVYEQMNVEKKETIHLTNADVEFIYALFPSEDSLGWLIQTSKFHEKNPIEIIMELFKGARFETDGNRGLRTEFHYPVCIDLKRAILDYYTSTNIFGEWMRDTENKCVAWCYEDKAFPVMKSFSIDGKQKTDVIVKDTEQIQHRDTGFYFDCDEETVIKWLLAIKRQFIDTKWYSTEQLEQITHFQNIISEINCRIILSNLRSLHNKLQKAYKDLKMKEE